MHERPREPEGRRIRHDHPPTQPEYRDVEQTLVCYPYDPRKATEMIQDLGYTRGSDGIFLDARGEPLSVEIRFVTSVDTTRLLSLATADPWARVGVDTQPLVISPQRNQDREYRAGFPSFELVNQPGGAGDVPGLLHSSGAPLPSNNFRASSGAYNRSRYINPSKTRCWSATRRRFHGQSGIAPWPRSSTTSPIRPSSSARCSAFTRDRHALWEGETCPAKYDAS